MVALVDIGGGRELSPEAAASWFRAARDGMPTGAITTIAPTSQTSSVYLKGLSGYLVD